MTTNSALDLLCPEAREQAMQLVEEATNKAIATQGIETCSMPREHAIAHEIGHAIVFTAYNIDVELIKVFEKSRGQKKRSIIGDLKTHGMLVDYDRLDIMLALPAWCGWTETAKHSRGYDQMNDSDDHRDREVRCMIAGRVGEQVFCDQQHDGSSLDEVVVAGMMCGDRETFRQLWRETAAILQRNANVAREMIDSFARSDRIEGEELQQMLARVVR